MSRYLRTHLLHYALILGLFLGGGLAIVLLPDRQLKLWIVGLLGAIYIIWGAWHHYEEHTLSWAVILEYAGIVALVLTVLLMVS